MGYKEGATDKMFTKVSITGNDNEFSIKLFLTLARPTNI